MGLRNLRLETLQRIELEEWMAGLKSRGLAASTRQQIIVSIRIYFYWLYEHRYIDVEPDSFVKLPDIPKRPKYLPRPIPPPVDVEIIHRLTESEDICHKGLLLMRFTGIRIGELTSLPFDCILEDGRGYRFLKVPLGKLNNERTVPLDPKTLTLLENIQSYSKQVCGKEKPEWLLCNSLGKKIPANNVQDSLRYLCSDIVTDKPITSHRLRHTFATSLLSGGMSLVGIMHLLGHHSLKMTLCYAAVTQETVREEYFAALKKIENRYDLPRQSIHYQQDTTSDPEEAIASVIQWIKRNEKSSLTPSANRQRTLLIKRLHRFKSEIEALKSNS